MSIEGYRSKSGQFYPGEILSATKLNDVALNTDRGTMTHSSIRTIQSTGGTVFMDEGEVPNLPYFDYPFKVQVSKDGSTNKFKVYVRAGMVNNFVPILKGGPNDGKYMDADPVPFLEFTSVSADNKKYVMLKVKKNNNSVYGKDPEISLVDSFEAAVDSDNEGNLILATILMNKANGQVTGVKRIYQYIYTSQMTIRVKAGAGVPVFWSFTSR